MSAIATFGPYAARRVAIVRPIPCAAPVISATLPVRRLIPAVIASSTLLRHHSAFTHRRVRQTKILLLIPVSACRSNNLKKEMMAAATLVSLKRVWLITEPKLYMFKEEVLNHGIDYSDYEFLKIEVADRVATV